MKRMLALLLVAMICLPCAAVAENGVSVRTRLSGSSAKRSNIERAAEELDSMIVPSGAYFSFNDAVGARTAARGYRSALNGRGVEVTGGGVAQVATTLYLALEDLNADVEYDDFKTYGEKFTDTYVSDPDEAILVDYSSGVDFAFTNWGDDLLIEMWTSESYLYCGLTLLEPEMAGTFLDWGAALDTVRLPVSSAGIELRGSDSMYNNVILAASSINDTVLMPGDLFSFNEAVGPRIEKYGYEEAINGRGVEVVGGGVAQVASAIWLALKPVDGIAILEKSTYGESFNQSYVESSNDAILTDYRLGTDFIFRNSGDAAITLATYVMDDMLYCEVFVG